MTKPKSTSTDPTDVSFLHEAQKSGKLSGDIEISDMDAAIASVHEIMVQEAVDVYHKEPEDKWGTTKLGVYCHDCRKIVPPKIAKVRRKSRVICGDCDSRKISMGRKEALERYYHLEKTES